MKVKEIEIQNKWYPKQLRKINPYIDKNIYRSTENVNLKTILSYKE